MRVWSYTLALLAFGGVAVGACGEEPRQDPFLDGDAGTVLPGRDAAAAFDAGNDGSADARARPDARDRDVDEPIRTCSDANVCHVPLPPGMHTLSGVWSDGSVAWAVSEEGEVLRYASGTWSIHATSLGLLRAIWGSGPGSVWIGGERGLYRGTGATPATMVFEPVLLPDEEVASQDVTSIWGTSENDVWATAGFRDSQAFPPTSVGAVFHTEGAAWTVDPISSSGVAFTNVFGSPGAGVFVIGPFQNGMDFVPTASLFRRAPGLDTFEPEALPIDPEGDPQFAALSSVGGGVAASDDRVFIAGRLGAFDPAGGQAAIWTGTRNAGGTFAWTFERDGFFLSPSTRALAASGPNDVWATGAAGRLRRFDGTAWAPVPTSISRFPTIAPLQGIWVGGPEDVWVVGKDIALRRGAL